MAIGRKNVLEVEFKEVWGRFAWRVTKCELEFDGFGSHVESKIFKSAHEQTYYIPFPSDNEWCTKIGENILLNQSEKEQLEDSIKSINEKYGKKVRWRAEEGMSYCFFDANGDVNFDKEYFHEIDNRRYNFGNYFKTKEEAEIALEKIKKVLSEEEQC